MILSILLFLFGGSWQERVPLKPNEEFELTVDYSFKARAGHSDSNLRVDYQSDNLNQKDLGGSGPLPYLVVYFKALKLGDDEVRVRVVSNLGKLVYSGKVGVGEKFKVDMGFTDDMKDRVGAFGYDINFINSNKDIVSRATLLVMDDGTFLVNGEKRGKF